MSNTSTRGNKTREKVEAYSVEKAREAGRRAWEEQASAQNPYVHGAAEHLAWSMGWHDGRDRASKR